MLNKEDYEIVKEQIDKNLTFALTYIKNVLRKCKSFKKYNYEINKIIVEHPIYKNRQSINEFAEMITNSDKLIKEKILEVQEKSEMRKKRKEEINQINNLIQTDYKFLLDSNKKNYIIKLLPSSSIIPLKESIYNKEDDILVEDTKDKEKDKLLNKKRKIEKGKINIENNINKMHDYNFSKCYICKKRLFLDNIHKFYGNLCTKCGDYNYSFRTMELDFSGRIAIVTGGRIKIGYYIATKLLSYGCKVLITTRFPKDALLKFKEHPDYEKWEKNLIIYPVDFRLFESVAKFINFVNENFPHLDILINNAAQTIRKTSTFYKYLLPTELKELEKEDEKKIIKIDYMNIQNIQNEIKEENKTENNIINNEIQNNLISIINKKENEYSESLPLSVIASQMKIMKEKNQPIIDKIGNDGQPYDFSEGKNSWNLEFDEIPFEEFIEVQRINAWVPYILCVKLKPLMLKSPFPDKYIVNVTAVEGIFNHFKRTTHVHTNMAKAALNMFTRTCGKYLKKDGIYMTCVDTGWVSPMNEMNKILDENEKKVFEEEFNNIPLDELDGAMRVLHPIIEGIKNKNYLNGILLKDYAKSEW